MSKYCPISQHNVVYLECLECEEKPCKKLNSNNPKAEIIPQETIKKQK